MRTSLKKTLASSVILMLALAKAFPYAETGTLITSQSPESEYGTLRERVDDDRRKAAESSYAKYRKLALKSFRKFNLSSFDGTITVRPADVPMTELTVPEHIEKMIKYDGDSLNIQTGLEDITVTVPRDLLISKLSAKSSRGDIRIESVYAGEITASSGSGNIVIDNPLSLVDADVSTVSGDIAIFVGNGSDFSYSVGTYMGTKDIEFKEITAKKRMISAESEEGDIRIRKTSGR